MRSLKLAARFKPWSTATTVTPSRLLSLSRRQGVTVEAVLHDLNLAASLCDHIFVLDQGRLVQEGQPGEVFTPELIAQVCRVEVPTLRHPFTGRPIIAP